jgi:uncharacterized protein with ATP-grasp and redox domains
MINGVRTELLARFPPDLQKAMAIRTLVDALLRESAERSNWLQIILAIDLLRDVIAETVKIQYATRKETKVFNSDEEMYKELDRYNGAILFLGHGSKSQFKDTKSVLTEVDRVVADLNAEYGEGKWVAVFGGDNYKKENPDIAHVMKYLNDKHHVPVLAIQSDVVTGRGGVDKYIDYVRYIPTMKDENGKTIWGGIREGKPVGPTAVYLGDGFVKGESPRLKKVVSIGGGPITLDETRLAYEKGVPVTYVRAETRFPGGNGVYGALEGWLEGLVGNLEGKSVIKFNRKAGISETTPVSRQLRVEDLLRQATGSQGDIEIEKLPSKNGVAVWMARTTRGIFRFEVLQEKNGQEEVDTFKDDAGSIWLIDEGGSILKTRDAHRLPDAMPQLVRDRFFNAWAYTEVPTSGPSMIDQMLRANNYSEGIVAELTGLKDEMKNGAVIRAPKGTGPEAEYWKNRPYIGQKWTSADVAALELFAYSNFLILEIVGYKQETGDNDPSAPIKDKALADALRTFPDLVEEIDGMTSDRDRLFELLAKAVWGNKFDPSNPMGEGMRFIRDERELAVRKLLDRRKQMIDYNADNAGPEILNDLLLIRQILKIDKYKKVRLQLKYTPLLVSDATRQDLDKTLEALAGHPSPLLKSLAKDLQSAIKGGRLIIVSDDATTVAGINFADRAGRARSMKENADIVIMKGDANYRWIFSNSHWGIDADPRQALPAYFPDTLILRAIKHEVMIGADKDLVEEMNRGKELLWYRNGTAGMVQYIAKTPGAVASDREAGDKLIVNHIVRSEGLAGIRLDGHRRHSHVVYTDLPSGMTKIEKGRLSPAGFNTAFQNRVIPVWEQEKDGITYYYLDLAGVQAKDYEQVLGREAIEIEKQYAQPRSRVTINYFDRSGKMRYDEIGDPVLPADIEADLSHFRTIRKGEAWAVGQNILTFLDDIQDMGGLKKDLKAAVKVGNGLTVLKPEVLETIGGVYDPQNKRYKKYHSKDDYIEKKTAQIAKLARTTGNELFISFLEYSPDDLPAKKEYYRKTGITGYVYRENGVLMVYRYAAGESQAVREVRFTTAEQLSSGIENSSEPYKMVYASDLRRLLQSGNVRAIDERIGAFSLLLRPLLLSISSGAGTNMITRGFVENVAFGWDPESLPGITPGHEQNVVNALEDKERPIDDVLAAMGLGEGISHPVKTYVLERLANAGKDEQDRRDLQTAFLKAIFREMLVREKMNGAVLADGELRGILGAKLYEKILRNIPGAAVRISPEAFIAKNDVTAVEFFVRLQAKIRELNADPSPEAINTIIVLAPLGERKTKFRIKHQETFNASSIDAILEAA